MQSNAASLNDIVAHYGNSQVLHGLNMSVADGELVSLLGSSGCGKTTTLRLLAGFIRPSSGSIALSGRDVTGLPPYRRGIGIVFQNYALFPHLTVAQNVGFGLKQRQVAEPERGKRVAAMLERVGLSSFADRYPSALSGGQRQRVALARALVIDPPLLMLDEPLSNLDAKLRVDMRSEIRELQRANKRTAIYVTHDQEEAFSISDRVAIMDAGRIVQLDAPETLFTRPVNAFVARFVGFENLVPMTVVERDGDRVICEAAGGVRTTLSLAATGPVGDRFVIGARPEGLAIGAPSNSTIPGTIGVRTYLGRTYQYRIDTPAGPLVANGPFSQPLQQGEAVGIGFLADQCCILPMENN